MHFSSPHVLQALPISPSLTWKILCEEYKLWSSSLCSFHQPPVSSSLSPHTLFSLLFSNTLILCSYLNIRDQVSQSKL
jgi:hypothetical protein